jgi:uncharacterized protein (DUF2236 family)
VTGSDPTARPQLAPPVEEVDWALGPGSVTWQVLDDPAVFLVGLLREALLLTLHPDFAAAAVDHDSFGDDPVRRFQHIAMYTYGGTYGSRADAERYSAMVRRRHTTIVGVEPMTGLPYRAHSEYELALTQVMLVESFLAAYESLNGELSGSKRDQFVREQKVPAALLGVNPDHMPDTYGGLVDFLTHARVRFAPGLQAREILDPFARGRYPRTTAIGGLPWHLRGPSMFGIRAMSDMAMLTMSQEERWLLGIDRRPKLGSATAVRASYKALSAFLRSERGREVWDDFLKPRVAAILARARAADAAHGRRERAATFVVPNAADHLVELPDLVRNWPGSTAHYALGDPARKTGAPAAAADRKRPRARSVS